MYLRPKTENKRKCKICGEKGFVYTSSCVFKSNICNWIEDEKQEKNHDLREGRNAKTFNEVKKEYRINSNKYANLIDKKIKVLLNNGEVKKGICRAYGENSILMLDNDGWLEIVDIRECVCVDKVAELNLYRFV